MDQWFYVLNGAQQGPLSVDQLAGLISSGQIAADTQVWCQRMAGWEPANRLPEFSRSQPMQAGYPTPGYPAAGYPPAGGFPLGYHSSQPMDAVAYAGFWIRTGAYLIDVLILLVPSMIIGFVIGSLGVLANGGHTDEQSMQSLNLINQVVLGGLEWLYFAVMESSARQATFGKSLCGLIVTDERGQRISFGRATGRFFAQYISALICGVGFMMAGWTQKKQGLHDIIAGTLVVRKTV